MDLLEITQTILDRIPAAVRLDVSDERVIKENKILLQRYENEVVQGFYDIVYAEEHLKVHVEEGLRSTRENTLRRWYQVTVQGHFDIEYYQWQVLIGIVHVKHHIPNVALLSMWGWMQNYLQSRLLEDLPSQEYLAISQVLQKLQTNVCALIVESFILTQQEALSQASGLKPALLSRFIEIEINQLLAQGREIINKSMEKQHAA